MVNRGRFGGISEMSLLPPRGSNEWYICKKISIAYDAVEPFGVHHHHQPINVSTAGVQAFYMDVQGERAITHHEGPVPSEAWRNSR
jgi:hypothetical protein